MKTLVVYTTRPPTPSLGLCLCNTEFYNDLFCLYFSVILAAGAILEDEAALNSERDAVLEPLRDPKRSEEAVASPDPLRLGFQKLPPPLSTHFSLFFFPHYCWGGKELNTRSTHY